MTPLEGECAHKLLETALGSGIVDSAWLAEHRFHPFGTYQVEAKLVGGGQLVVWQQSDGQTFLLVNVINHWMGPEFFSRLAGVHLSTGTRGGDLYLPNPPNNLIQAFPVRTASELWCFHNAALQFLQTMGIGPSHERIADLPALLSNLVSEWVGYIRTKKFWRWRMPIWLLFRRRMLYGKSIQEIYARDTTVLSKTELIARNDKANQHSALDRWN